MEDIAIRIVKLLQERRDCVTYSSSCLTAYIGHAKSQNQRSLYTQIFRIQAVSWSISVCSIRKQLRFWAGSRSIAYKVYANSPGPGSLLVDKRM